jgi:hypothetical protein
VDLNISDAGFEYFYLSGYYVPNLSPTVGLESPDDLEEISDTTPTLEFIGTDTNSDDIDYQVQVDTVNTFDSQVTSLSYKNTTSLDAPYSRTVLYSGGNVYGGEYFVASSGGTLTSCKLYVCKYGTVSGNVVAYLYAATGSPETATPTGSILATSDAVSTANLDTEFIPTSLVTFTFSGSEQYALTSGNAYFCVIYSNAGSDSSNYVGVGICDNGSTGLSGMNPAYSTNGSSWSTQSSWEYGLEVYTTSTSPLISTDSSVSATGFANIDTPADTRPFNSGDLIGYTVQNDDELSADTYYWRARGKDPTGSDTWGAWATTRSFTLSTATGTNMKLNVGDSWKTVTAVKVNVGDSWKPVTKVQVNVGDSWKTVF